MSLEKLAEISRFYGGNTEYVIAGGGNTSFKDKNYLYIKASGTSLALAKPEDFVKMKRAALAAVWEKSYPENPAAREAAVLADMMAARAPGEEAKRPSVETLLHDMLPFPYVVHTHPALVNGLCCSQNGKEAARELFPGAIWIPLINPGYILSKAVKDALAAVETKNTGQTVIFLQNHGIFAAADSPEEIREIYKNVMETIGGKTGKAPDFGEKTALFGNSGGLKDEILLAAKKLFKGGPFFIEFERNKEFAALVEESGAFKAVSGAFTPDHIVYSGSDPLFIEDASNIENALKAHLEKTGGAPKIIAVKSTGVFGIASSEKAAANALELFRDAVKVALFSGNFGGPRFMSVDQIDFINNWEVESYRTKVSE